MIYWLILNPYLGIQPRNDQQKTNLASMGNLPHAIDGHVIFIVLSKS